MNEICSKVWSGLLTYDVDIFNDQWFCEGKTIEISGGDWKFLNDINSQLDDLIFNNIPNIHGLISVKMQNMSTNYLTEMI